jgi:DNA-directed RNA polymerase subunit RPC12/RpoP
MRTPASDGTADDPQITVVCRNCGEEITDSRARLKKRDWECPYCGGSAIGDEDEQPLD